MPLIKSFLDLDSQLITVFLVDFIITKFSFTLALQRNFVILIAAKYLLTQRAGDSSVVALLQNDIVVRSYVVVLVN